MGKIKNYSRTWRKAGRVSRLFKNDYNRFKGEGRGRNYRI